VPDRQQQPGEVDVDAGVDEVSELPPIHLPKTKAPASFNQQNNFYQQIPSSAWDRLSPEQIVDLSKKVLDHANAIDERHFEFAKNRLQKSDRIHQRNMVLGSMVVIVGFALTAYLAMKGHEIIAITISLPLSTIIAMLVGNQLLT